MTDTRVVVFTSNNARVLLNPENLEELCKLPNVLINPDFRYVMGIPPHQWTINGNGDLVGFGRYKRPLRQAHVESSGCVNDIASPYSFKTEPSFLKRFMYKIKQVLGRFV